MEDDDWDGYLSTTTALYQNTTLLETRVRVRVSAG